VGRVPASEINNSLDGCAAARLINTKHRTTGDSCNDQPGSKPLPHVLADLTPPMSVVFRNTPWYAVAAATSLRAL
jgi:hypothetical protein